MDKIVDLFLKTPLAKRYAEGFAERAIIWALGAIALWLKLDPATYTNEIAKFAAQVAPYAAAAVMVVIAQKRMKKAEVTIAVAHASDPDVSRAAIDQQAKIVLKDPSAPKAA